VKVEKGDLVLISDGTTTSTCIILTDEFVICSNKNRGFYYSVCLESGVYGIVYNNEITSVACKGFAPDYEFKSELFETDYSYYAEMYRHFAYFPSFWEEDSSDDED
tara:strand:+ start:22 stop:339 length:318 start_codon:yes stop_codon:yes gene_type:complete